MLGHGENGTVIDDFGETTNRDFQSQSFFFREDGLMMGGHANATIRTIGEETSNQVTNNPHTNMSGHGQSNRNDLRDQQNNMYSNRHPRNDARRSGFVKSDSDENENEDMDEMMQKDRHDGHYQHDHIDDDHDAKRGENVRNQAATSGFQLQMIVNAIGGDQRAYRHQMNQNEKMNRRASHTEN